MVPPGPHGDDPFEGGAAPDDWPPAPRPYPTRPYPTRPYPTRPYGAPGPESRPYPTRPYPTRPYPTRPYPTRPYPTRPDADAPAGAGLDAHEWTADVSELFIARSAVIGLGARLLFGEGRIPVPQVTGAGSKLEPPRYVERPRVPLPGDAEPKLQAGEAKPHGRAALRALYPSRHELAWNVIVPDELARELARHPEPAWAVKDDVARALALRADKSWLRGDPFTGVNHVAGDATVAATADAVARTMLGAVRARAGVVFDSAGWILSAETLEQLAVAAQGDRSWDSTFLLTPDGADGGLLLGYPFITSAAAGDRLYFSADWSEAWIGVERRAVTVDVSTDVQFQSDETVIRAVAHHDLVIRRPELFAVGHVG
jgi:hypothetical protein